MLLSTPFRENAAITDSWLHVSFWWWCYVLWLFCSFWAESKGITRLLLVEDTLIRWARSFHGNTTSAVFRKTAPKFHKGWPFTHERRAVCSNCVIFCIVLTGIQPRFVIIKDISSLSTLFRELRILPVELGAKLLVHMLPVRNKSVRADLMRLIKLLCKLQLF